MSNSSVQFRNSAMSREVSLKFLPLHLVAMDEQGKQVFQWTISSLEWTQKLMPSSPAILRSKEDKNGMLLIESPSQISEIKKRMRTDPFGRNSFKRSYFSRNLTIVLVIICSLAAFYGSYYSFVDLAVKYFPNAWQTKIGEDYLSKITARHPICRDQQLNRLLAKIYKPIIALSKSPLKPQVHLIKNNEINALTLPGGIILINTGLITKLSDPRTLAGIIAHEVAHLHHRHNLEMLIRNAETEFFALMLVGKPGVTSKLPFLVTAKYSRLAEIEADTTAAAYLDQLKISKKPFAQFFINDLANDSLEKWLTFISSHPSNESRAKALKDSLEIANNPVLSQSEWQQVQEILKRSDNCKANPPKFTF